MQTSQSLIPENEKMYKTKNDITPSRRSTLNRLMNLRLASVIDLQMQMKQAHWNVKGPQFISLHELFDKVHRTVESYVDILAERIVQLGGIAEGTIRISATRTQLEEYPTDLSNGMDHIEAVSRALASFGHQARSTINEATELEDADTADLFTEISRDLR